MEGFDMGYFNYHNRLKQLLNTEKYICVPEEYPFAYRFIFPRLLKSMPIRDYRVIEYKNKTRLNSSLFKSLYYLLFSSSIFLLATASSYLR